MTSRRTERGKEPFLRTIRFVADRWRRQWRLALAMATGLVLIAAAELALPIFAGQMVDSLADPARPRAAAVLDALRAFAAILGLGVALVVLRWGLFKGIIRFTLRMMSEVARDESVAIRIRFEGRPPSPVRTSQRRCHRHPHRGSQ
jgi:ATP-binding cassette subfamily B protein